MKILPILLFFSLCFHLSVKAQRGRDWLENNKIGAYYEGVYTKPAKSSTMELVSLIAYWEPYEFNKNQSQQIMFNSPNNSISFIKAEELNILKNYWFQSGARHQAKEGKNKLTNWRIDAVLSQLELDRNSLGLIVRIGEKADRNFSPAWIYKSSKPERVNNYQAQIRLGIGIKRGDWKLYGGADAARSSILMSKRLMPTSGGTCIPLSIPIAKLRTSSQWYTIVLNVVEDGVNADNHTYSFRFYHSGNKD